ncbi:MAG: DUF465 domain-containing protein [Bacteroidetes bacterium]|nr:DUF465 domain-containing protein [Bacteroidota bacterium]
MEKHNLAQEFPQYKEKIHDLKMQNAHFKKLFDDYDKTDNHIHRIESGAEVAIDEHLNELRTHRVFLKDQLYNLLQQ